ncbi:MAG TPA: MFS transporter, partial [Candidatus Binatia bacterium]
LIPWLGVNFIGVALAVTMLGVTAFGTNPLLQTLVAQMTSDRLRDTGFAWFYTATFLAGAVWSPTVGYLSEWLGLKAVFGAMAVSFFAAILCVLCGRFHEVSRVEQPAAEAVLHG